MLLNESTFAEWASNKTCAPLIQNCMKEYQQKYVSRYNTPAAKDAIGRCNAIYRECGNDNGVIMQSGGSYAQMYHPQNPTFLQCKKKIDDISSDAFSQCMKNGGQVRNVPTPTPKPTSEIIVNAPVRSCGKEYPSKCTTQETCAAANGVWSGTACAIAPCPSGTTPDRDTGLGNTCKCDNDANFAIERGTEQQCPSMCRAEEHKVYNVVARGCICAGGYRDPSGLGVCVASETPAQPSTAGMECLRELQEKATACNAAATTAVDKCDPKRNEGGNDTIGTLQSLLQSGALRATGAADNCAQAAVAGSTGYYALEELRNKCDTEINSCKTSCTDATSFINANKDRVYQECRKKQWTYYTGNGFSCRFDNPFPLAFTEDAWNAEWDQVNKSEFDRQIQQMQTGVAQNNTKCDSGTAVTNRSKMTDFMNDMDTAYRSASQCECQLSSGGTNCNNLVGPKDCAIDPTLPGCTTVKMNCLSATDNSPKCVCFRNPNSDECKNIRAAAVAVKPNSNINGFAGSGGMAPTNGFGETSGSGSNSGVTINPGDLNGMDSNEIAAGDASGTSTADAVTPFAAASGSGAPGAGGNFGSGESNAAAADRESSLNSKIGGMFNTAKGALGNLLGGKKNNSETAKYGSGNGSGLDANGNPMDPTKWRPRGKMIRGLASGSETAIAGKFEDIWKVMNRQYKVQDQKDSFIFGEKN